MSFVPLKLEHILSPGDATKLKNKIEEHADVMGQKKSDLYKAWFDDEVKSRLSMSCCIAVPT